MRPNACWLLGVIVAYAGIGVLRRQCWAWAALATACGGAAVFGAVGVWSLLRWGWFRDTSVPFEAVLIAGVAAYALRLLCGDSARRQFDGTATLIDGRVKTCGFRKGWLPGLGADALRRTTTYLRVISTKRAVAWLEPRCASETPCLSVPAGIVIALKPRPPPRP
jgi:hypothetical protein